MEDIRRALVLGLVLIAGTAIEQAPFVGPRSDDILLLQHKMFNCKTVKRFHTVLIDLMTNRLLYNMEFIATCGLCLSSNILTIHPFSLKYTFIIPMFFYMWCTLLYTCLTNELSTTTGLL